MRFFVLALILPVAATPNSMEPRAYLPMLLAEPGDIDENLPTATLTATVLVVAYTVTPTPVVVNTATSIPTAMPTATQRPTSTFTPVATATSVSSGAVPGASSGGAGACAANPSASNAPNSPVRIVTVNKSASPESVVIKNVSGGDVDVNGWRICSITGNQIHAVLSGSIGTGVQTTVNSFAAGPIWNNSSCDDGALYNSGGGLVRYWVDPTQ